MKNSLSRASSFTLPASLRKHFPEKEVTLSEPVKAGYRVRAVVYWTQNEELFLPKGNDYEESFHRPDDSVGVVAKTVEETPTIAVDGVVTEDQDFTVKVAGTVPEGSMILVKSYPADTLEFAMTGGTWVASKFDVSAGTYTITPNTGVLSAGDKVVAFLQRAEIFPHRAYRSVCNNPYRL